LQNAGVKKAVTRITAFLSHSGFVRDDYLRPTAFSNSALFMLDLPLIFLVRASAYSCA
jgi:hypothetical protein